MATQEPRSVLTLSQGKSGSTALMTAIAQTGNLRAVMEPKDLTTIDSRGAIVAKKLINDYRPEELRMLCQFGRRIFLVRDPRDVMVSRIRLPEYTVYYTVRWMQPDCLSWEGGCEDWDICLLLSFSE